MKCKKNKQCKKIYYMEGKGKCYICAGINMTPTKHKYDNVWLCLKGRYVKSHRIEMTREEALVMISAMSLAVSELI